MFKFLRKSPRISEEQYLAKLVSRGVDPETGHVKPDPQPIAPPIGYKKSPSMVELVREMVRGERLAEAARAAGKETFEESEDFDTGDEDGQELRSGFENDFDPPLSEVTKEVSRERAEREARAEQEADRKARSRFYRRSAPQEGVERPDPAARPQEPPKAP